MGSVSSFPLVFSTPAALASDLPSIADSPASRAPAYLRIRSDAGRAPVWPRSALCCVTPTLFTARARQPNASDASHLQIRSRLADCCLLFSLPHSEFDRISHSLALPVMLRHPSPLVLVFTPICTDGHRKVIVEHTLHIVLLPGLHSVVCQTGPPHTTIAERTLSVSSMTSGPTSLGLDLSLPSPLHLRLPIISRLSFNESGKITHHRDFWDLKVRNHMLPLKSPG